MQTAAFRQPVPASLRSPLRSSMSASMSAQARQFIFTITTGRSGTQFLTQLLSANLADAEVHHEQRAHKDWGVNCPDVSHLTTFNQVGNTGYVRAFWQQKLARIAATPSRYFAETSHTLAKAGLVENLDALQGAGTVHLVYLKRDIADTAISLAHRADFCTKGNMWLWYLAPNYANLMMDPRPLIEFGQIGLAIWYVVEMRARAEYYRLLVAGQSHIRFHEFDMERTTDRTGAAELLNALGTDVAPEQVHLPGKVNANVVGAGLAASEKELIRAIVADCRFDAAEVARSWHRQGRALGPLL